MSNRKVSVGHFETTDDMRKNIQSVLDSGRISYGPMCKRLEEEFAEIHEVPYAIVSASGTDALRAGLHAMKIQNGWENGSEVIVPATTFVATVNVVEQINLKPVLVDVEPEFYCIDVDKIDDSITNKTVAIFPVNLLGQPANLSEVARICWDYQLDMIEDSAEAMFVRHSGIPVGSWGHVSGFSFYMAHLITAGVGGITTTHDPEIADMVRSLINHGRHSVYTSIDDDDDLNDIELQGMVYHRFRFVEQGYSTRMTELQAALALPQLAERNDMLANRQAIAGKLTAGLSKHASRLQLPAEREEGEHSYMMYGIRMRGGVDKNPLVMHLEKNGIETRDMLPLINQPCMEHLIHDDPEKLWPVSHDLIKTGFYIGCHQGMTAADADYVCEVVDDFFS